MNNIINDSKFILSKKVINYDRFSGQLSLAMSYEKPLIIDIKTKDAYNLPGITFNTNYSEVGCLDDITDEKYKLLKNEIKSFKNDLIYKSKTIFKQFNIFSSVFSLMYGHSLQLQPSIPGTSR